MAKENKPQKKKKGRSVQDLMGIKTFTKYGLATSKGELLFYLVSPTNISVKVLMPMRSCTERPFFFFCGLFSFAMIVTSIRNTVGL